MNSITVDVEEYFHAANLEPVAPPAKWHAQVSRVEYSTDKLLEIFCELGLKTTFFILGSTARRHPALIRRIADAGHEIASHGYGHRLVRAQNVRSFYRDVRRTKYLLEQITSKIVLGYRAPNFSIRDDTPWAYEALVKAGYLYDSSLHPVAHPRYGNTHRSFLPDRIETAAGVIYEMPLSVWPLDVQLPFSEQIRKLRIPCSGGAYWRLFPTQWILFALERGRRSNPNMVCYLHPWEVDANQPVFSELDAVTRFRHYAGTESLPKVIRKVGERFGSVPLSTILFEAFPEAKELAATRCPVRT